MIGPRANEVLLDWYSGTPPYTISPLEGIKSAAGESVKVNYAANNDDGAAVKLARESDVAIVCVGNHPNGGFDTVWAKVSVPSEGREAVDRQSITLEQEDLIKAVYAANPKTIVVLKSSFPYAINWTQDNVPCDSSYGAEQPGRRTRAGVCALRRLQPCRPFGPNVAQVARATAADDGLRHPPRQDLHVLSRHAAVSIRIWLELHDVRIPRPEDQRRDSLPVQASMSVWL